MDYTTLLRQGVLFVHLLAFAIAVSAVLREDIALLASDTIDSVRLNETARTVGCALLVLWITGLALIGIDCAFHPSDLELSAKIKAKLFVVVALTANGLALHNLAFPVLQRRRAGQPRKVAAIAALGGISTASWLYASFIGVSRVIAPMMNFADFMRLYGWLLAVAISVAVILIRPRVERLLLNS